MIAISKCQHNGPEKSVEAPPKQLLSVVLTISVLIIMFLGRDSC